jgi:hypothetical protein
MIKISDDTIAVVDFLDKFTNGNLRKKGDLELILEIAATFNESDILNRLIFASKSVWNISSKLKKVNPTADGIELLQKEMERNCIDMTEYLKVFYQYADDSSKKRFEDVYLQLTRGAFKNLIDLAHDFAKFKELQMISRNK